MSPDLAYKLADLFLVLLVGAAWGALLVAYFDMSDQTDRKKEEEK